MFISALKSPCLAGKGQAAAAGGLRGAAVTLTALCTQDLLHIFERDRRFLVLVGSGLILMDGEIGTDALQPARRRLNRESGIVDVLARLREHVGAGKIAQIRDVLFRFKRHGFDLQGP